MNNDIRSDALRDGFMMGVAASFVAAIIMAVALELLPRHKFRDEAVRAGVAEYYLDEDHNKQFRWITNQSKVKP